MKRSISSERETERCRGGYRGKGVHTERLKAFGETARQRQQSKRGLLSQYEGVVGVQRAHTLARLSCERSGSVWGVTVGRAIAVLCVSQSCVCSRSPHHKPHILHSWEVARRSVCVYTRWALIGRCIPSLRIIGRAIAVLSAEVEIT